MPAVPFDALPDDARLWVFASPAPLDATQRARLLDEVDRFLETWAAHGAPLRAARDWRDERFLAVGVDQSTAGASGCSIDGLFRRLQALEPELGTSLLRGGAQIYWRDGAGAVQSVPRAEMRSVTTAGALHGETPVFDTSLTSAGEWRRRFERPARESWHAALL
jgi:hypothetical protein